ncbi:cupin domain-containing protein [Capnocytophaga canimorsus]|uniref:cupin domain-containing protein n=1 Tax=Capnocytophaga canimorsus TaxID=28188 RepID=UPI0037D26A1F
MTMKIASFQEDLAFNTEKISVELILDSEFSKEIRITLAKGQVMKEHQTQFPIVVHVLEGCIEFGIYGKPTTLLSGTILSLEGNVPHDLKAIENSVVRLTLAKTDSVTRVQKVSNN